MNKQELEQMPLTEIAYNIIKEEKKDLNTADLFKKVCNLLEYSEAEYESQIGDFFTMLTTDKNFTVLSNGNWDLRDNHNVNLVIDEDGDDIEEVEDEFDEEDTTDDMEEKEDETVDDVEDDMDDLSIIDEDMELEE